MPRTGRQDRQERLQERHGGFRASSSQDLLIVAARLFELSRRSAEKAIDGNWSSYTYAGLPLLLAALQAFVVEHERRPDQKLEPSDINRPLFVSRYAIDGELRKDFDALIELRNEIIHPAHVQTGTGDNWPTYLSGIKEKGLLNSTGDPNADYALLSQIASHRLFAWAIHVLRALYEAVITSDPHRAPLFTGCLNTFDSAWFSPLPDSLLW